MLRRALYGVRTRNSGDATLRGILALRLRRGLVGDACVRWIAIALMVTGACIFALALFADAFGIGAAGSAFGWKQLIGTMLGGGICLGGARGWWELAHPGAGET